MQLYLDILKSHVINLFIVISFFFSWFCPKGSERKGEGCGGETSTPQGGNGCGAQTLAQRLRGWVRGHVPEATHYHPLHAASAWFLAHQIWVRQLFVFCGGGGESDDDSFN